MKTNKVILLSLFFVILFCKSQNNYINSDNIKRCDFLESNSSITLDYLKNFSEKLNKVNIYNNLSSLEENIKIPIVVHVISNKEVIDDNTNNISDLRVISQINSLNNDFQRKKNTLGFNENPLSESIPIEFKLALKNPQGNPTNGINRIKYKIESFKTYSEIEEMKTLTAWNTNKYVNIWVLEFSKEKGSFLNSSLGLSNFPSDLLLDGLTNINNKYNIDGIVINWKSFGNEDFAKGTYYKLYNKGRTLTHEMGHFLGLLHTFNEQGQCIDNDYCEDTPVQSVYNQSFCIEKDSCPESKGKDMIQNYLDYSPDSCMNTFTKNQKERILKVLENSPKRNSLIKSDVLEEVINTQQNENIITEKSKYYIKPIYKKDKSFDYLAFSLENQQQVELEIYSLNGNIVYKEIKNIIKDNLTFNNLKKGIYIIKIKIKDKIIIENIRF